VIHEEAKTGIAESIAVTLEIIAAKLIDHDHYDELGMTAVG
jgi:hypothetical protein